MQSLYESFVLNFIKDDRWKYLTNGLAVTLKITFFAVLLGLAIGFVGGRFFAGEDFKFVTGWCNYSGCTYYFQGDGRVVTGDYVIDGKLCHFDQHGRYQP